MMTLDIIGPLYEPATFDQEGNELTPAVLLDGFHVNIAPEDMTPELEAYRVQPAKPHRVWAGLPDRPTPTAFLRFADEAEARAALGVE